MEVYAVTREFAEWGKGVYNRLPTPLRNGLKAAGVCHYLVVFKKSDVEYVMYDFGPVGGDVTGILSGGGRRAWRESPVDRAAAMRKSASDSSLLASSTAALEGGSDAKTSDAIRPRLSSGAEKAVVNNKTTMRRSVSARKLKNVADGEIREEWIDALPKDAHLVGRTDLTVDDVRTFNAVRSKMYSLHGNDCRHYMNDLCAYACPEAAPAFPRGVASRVSWRNTWGRVRGGRPHEALYVMPLQFLADVNNMPVIRRIRSACSASVVFGVCIRAVPFLCRPVCTAVFPVAAAMNAVRTPPARRLVTTAAGVSAGVSANAPVVRQALYVGDVALNGRVEFIARRRD